jgi:hypothetical protein
MLLRHQDTQSAFEGYDYFGSLSRPKKTEVATVSSFRRKN